MNYKELVKEAAIKLVTKSINNNFSLFGNLKQSEQEELRAAFIESQDRSELAAIAWRAERDLMVDDEQESTALLVCMSELKAGHAERLRTEFNAVIEEYINEDLVERYSYELGFAHDYMGAAA